MILEQLWDPAKGCIEGSAGVWRRLNCRRSSWVFKEREVMRSFYQSLLILLHFIFLLLLSSFPLLVSGFLFLLISQTIGIVYSSCVSWLSFIHLCHIFGAQMWAWETFWCFTYVVPSICNIIIVGVKELAGMQEKMEYQLEERTRDMQELLESCQTKVWRVAVHIRV